MTLDATLRSHQGAWLLTMERDFAHPPEVVWPWLTEPERLARWSPVVPDGPFDAHGPRQVRENPGDDPVDGEVLTIDPPRELVHRWGDDNLVRWRLTPTAAGCRLTLEQTMPQRDPAAMNAAGWDVCLAVLDEVLGGSDTPRATGPDAAARGWAALRDDYAEALGT
ncbi:MAG: hypothetical protein QOD90_4986 [Mycobacterium sp.]|nr:hypothetical protein [Mycobacterium sp.]